MYSGDERGELVAGLLIRWDATFHFGPCTSIPLCDSYTDWNASK